MNSKEWNFEVGKQRPEEERAQVGKPEWPDLVILTMPKSQAWEVVHCILAQIERGDHEIDVDLFGKMSSE